MADGIIFEKLGIPAASIVTDSFRATGDAMAKRQGMPGYHYAMLPHPTVNLTPEECVARAQDVLPDIVRILGLEDRAPKAGVAVVSRATVLQGAWPATSGRSA